MWLGIKKKQQQESLRFLKAVKIRAYILIDNIFKNKHLFILNYDNCLIIFKNRTISL